MSSVTSPVDQLFQYYIETRRLADIVSIQFQKLFKSQFSDIAELDEERSDFGNSNEAYSPKATQRVDQVPLGGSIEQFYGGMAGRPQIENALKLSLRQSKLEESRVKDPEISEPARKTPVGDVSVQKSLLLGQQKDEIRKEGPVHTENPGPANESKRNLLSHLLLRQKKRKSGESSSQISAGMVWDDQGRQTCIDRRNPLNNKSQHRLDQPKSISNKKIKMPTPKRESAFAKLRENYIKKTPQPSSGRVKKVAGIETTKEPILLINGPARSQNNPGMTRKPTLNSSAETVSKNRQAPLVSPNLDRQSNHNPNRFSLFSGFRNPRDRMALIDSTSLRRRSTHHKTELSVRSQKDLPKTLPYERQEMSEEERQYK